MKRLALLALMAGPAFGADEPLASPASAYGCEEYEFATVLPSVEGKDGVFFRSFADLRLQHPMDDAVMERLGRLAAALRERGTVLVYVTIPAKSQVMPDYLPARAADYGFDIDIAETVYDGITSRLQAQGIVAPDLMRALRDADPAGPTPLFGADFHWSSDGAQLAAMAIGTAVKADPAYAEITPKAYESKPIGMRTAFSGMRRTLQTFCKLALPPVESQAWETVQVGAADGAVDIFGTEPAAGLDIFGTSEGLARPDAVLVGTSFSDSEVNNFAGFLQEYAGLEVVNYAITGGNQYGAITSYLTSADFAKAPPRFLIWENPIYNNLGQYGPGPLEELIAAASPDCATPLAVQRDGADGLTARLDGVTADDRLMIDFGGEGSRKVDVVLDTASGVQRRAQIARSDRQRATGQFTLDLGAYWMPDLTAVTVRFDRALPTGTETTPGLSLCRAHADKGVTP